ncbi:hypothetical protein ABW19_dt0201918 [Dactylella cylindrospora]|nr:hypothetical protein ABW19_dt0201918 [Dactylella cylindrospora]
MLPLRLMIKFYLLGGQSASDLTPTPGGMDPTMDRTDLRSEAELYYRFSCHQDIICFSLSDRNKHVFPPLLLLVRYRHDFRCNKFHVYCSTGPTKRFVTCAITQMLTKVY